MRTILISGASRGIGRAIAERALEDGHRISIGIRNPKDIEGTKLDPEISGSDKVVVSKYEAEISRDAKDWIEKTRSAFNTFDSIIHCAGIFKRTGLLFADSEYEDIEKLWRVNVIGPWLLTRDSWSELCKSTSGRVIILASMSGKRSKGKLAGYTMSKFAIMGLSQTIRNEGWDKGIRVSTICPGWVNTDMSLGVKSINRIDMTQPKDIASICSNLLELPNSCIPFEIAVNCNLESNT